MNDKKGFWRTINPTIKDKMETNPNLSVMGLWWAGYWRFVIIIAVISLIFIILTVILGISLGSGH